MRRGRARAGAVLAVGILGVLALAGPVAAIPEPSPAPPSALLPPPSEQLAPVLSGASPVVWQACRSVGLAVGLVAVAGTLAGVPADVSLPFNDLFGRLTGPVLNLFFEVCQQLPLPDDPPDCAVDAQVPALPSLGRPVLIAALLANELRALDDTLTGLGAPLEGALGDAADDLLACSQGRNPEPDPPAEEPVPAQLGFGAPPSTASSGGSGSPAPLPGEVAQPRLPAAPQPGGGTGGVGLGAVSAASSRDQGNAGLALGLLGVAALAVVAWAYAGSARAERPHAAEEAAA